MRINPLTLIKAFKTNMVSGHRDIRISSDNREIKILIQLGSHRDDALVLIAKYNHNTDRVLFFRLCRGGWEYHLTCSVYFPGSLIQPYIVHNGRTLGEDHRMDIFGNSIFLTSFRPPVIVDSRWISKDEIEHLVTRFILEYSD